MEAGTPELVKLEDLQTSSSLTGRKHILSLLVENKPGVLARIAGLFSRRGFNIDTLAVGPTEDPEISRITHKDELADGMKTALETEGTVLVDVRVTKEENCYPMIPAGQAARDMVG